MKPINKNINIIFVLILAIFTSSCDLEEYNPSGSTPETVWKTPTGFETLIAGAYGQQRAFYGKSDAIVMSEAGTDIWFRSGKATNWKELFRYQDLSGTMGNSNINFWRGLWPGINLCNAGIGRINDVLWNSDNERKNKEGELRFLRAFYYYHIVETWGGVMLRTKETTEPELTAKRSPVEDFYTLMISDLDSAVAWLPVPNPSIKAYSRATKKSAMGLLAKVLLTRAYYSLDKNNADEAKLFFTRAKNVAHALIDSASKWGISLYPNYSDLWKNQITGGNNKNSKEALYIISNSTDPTLNYDVKGCVIHQYFTPNYTDKPGMMIDVANGKNSTLFMPTKYMLNLFDEKDSRYNGSFQDTWYANKIENNKQVDYVWKATDAKKYGKDASVIGDTIHFGDTAIYCTPKIITDKRTQKYLVIDGDSLFSNDTIRTNINIFPGLIKFADPNRAEASTEAGTNDIIVMRLAEMYLIAAEAEIQLGEFDAARDDINVIRRRASKTHTGDLDITSSDIQPVDKGIAFILDERAREFAGEHMRWYDLKRTRMLVKNIEQYNKDIRIPDNLKAKGNGIFENIYLRPIPQSSELDKLLNADEFGQNPGY